MLRLKDICQLTDGEKRNGKGICLDAKFLRGKSSATIIEKGRFVYAGDNIILVDGENSGEVFLFHKMDIWEAHSNSYGFLRLCGSLVFWLSSCSIKRH